MDMTRLLLNEMRRALHRRAVWVLLLLAFVGIVTAVLAVIFTVPDVESGPLVPAVCMMLGVIGLAVSIAFFALDGHRQHGSSQSARIGAPTDTATSIYLASIGFFGFAVAIGTALLLLR